MTAASRNRVPAWTFAVAAMLSVQLGAAVSVQLFDSVGVEGTAFLRLSVAALGFIVIARPRYWQWTIRELRAPLFLGLLSAMMTVSFMAAIARIPLGTSVAIEFLGPLTVAAAHSQSRRGMLWPLLALLGVLLLTEPWRGSPNALGIVFAMIAAIGWGLYIIVTQHVGDRFAGVDGLAISIPTASLALAGFGLPHVWGHLSAHTALVAAGSAILLPLIPWTLELYALRRLTKSAFGTLMSLEPAIALLIGMLLLDQVAAPWQYLGVACVVLAGVGAERTGHREADRPDFETPAN